MRGLPCDEEGTRLVVVPFGWLEDLRLDEPPTSCLKREVIDSQVQLQCWSSRGRFGSWTGRKTGQTWGNLCEKQTGWLACVINRGACRCYAVSEQKRGETGVSTAGRAQPHTKQ